MADTRQHREHNTDIEHPEQLESQTRPDDGAEEATPSDISSSTGQQSNVRHPRQENQQRENPNPQQQTHPGQPNASDDRDDDANEATPPSLTSLRQEARVATVIYDMLIRAGPNAETMSAPLSQAYPVAAALARQYASYANQVLFPPLLHAQMPSLFHRRGDFVLRRISVSSVAWFCSFVASAIATLRLWLIFSLALGATLANASDNEILYLVVSYVARETLDKGPRRELYKWMFRLMNEGNPVVVIGRDGPTAGSLPTGMPSYLATALLLTPFTSGLVGFALGALAAIIVNLALKVAGGIRFENHED